MPIVIKGTFPFIQRMNVERQTDGSFFYKFGNNITFKSLEDPQNQALAYTYCSPLATVINSRAKAFLNAKLILTDTRTNEPIKNAEGNKLLKLLENPNILQGGNEFLTQAWIFKDLFGECFILKVKPFGTSNIKELYVLPNWAIKVNLSDKVYFKNEGQKLVTGYQVTVNGNVINLQPDEVIHIKDFSVNTLYTNKEFSVRGLSRTIALSDQINNIVTAYNSRRVLASNRGAMGILSNEGRDAIGSTNLDPKEKQQVQDYYKNSYGLEDDKFQIIITSLPLRWNPISLPTKDLMLFEEIEDDILRINEAYDRPIELTNIKTQSSLGGGNMKKEAKAQFYQEAIIPEAEAFYNGICTDVDFDTYALNYWAKPDYSHIEVLQKSEQEKATVMKETASWASIAFRNKVITKEEYRIAMGYDPNKIEGNTYYDGQTNANNT